MAPPSVSTAPRVAPARAASSSASASASASCVAQTPVLAATALKVGPAPSALSAGLGLWLADESSALLSATPDSSWAEGAVSRGAGNSATRAVTLSRVPKALRAWLGRPVRVLGASGAVCDTRLQRFLIRAQITPDSRTAEHWEGCADGPAVPAQAIADEIWRLTASAGRSLIAEFSAPCKGALLAVDPDLPAPAIAAPEPAPAEAGELALAAFRKLPAYAAIQARFHAEQPGVDGAWDDRNARRNVSALGLPGREMLVFVSVQVGSGCGGFSASLNALWRVDGSTLAVATIDDRRVTPSAVVDLGGAGSSVLLGPDGQFQARSVLRLRSDGDRRYERIFLSAVPFFPGPC